MSRFSIRNPYLIVVVCLIVIVIGLTSVVRMPVDPRCKGARHPWVLHQLTVMVKAPLAV